MSDPLLASCLVRLEQCICDLPDLPPDKDVILLAQNQPKKQKTGTGFGIGKVGMNLPDGGEEAKKRSMSLSELKQMSTPLDEEHYADGLHRVIKAQSVVRRWHAKRAMKVLLKRRNKKAKLFEELLETEETYVQKIGGVTQIILEPLEWNAQVSPDPLLPKAMITEIFSNIKQLYALNKTLLHDLVERIRKNYHEYQKIGDVFLQLTPHLELYSTYYNQHDRAIQMLDRASTKYPNFVDFLEKCKNHPDFVNMRLETLLIEPVQRIPRYIMYLQDVLKNTAEEHPDYQNLCDAVDQISGVAKDIDEKMNEIEQTKKILEIQRKIVAGDLFETLVAPKRCFLRKGQLLKCKLDKNIFTKDVDQVYLFLFSDLLLVTAKTVGSYQCKAVVPLGSNLVRLKPVADMTLVQNVFYLITPARTFTFMGQDPDEKEAWMNDLNRCISNSSDNSQVKKGDRIDVTILGSEVRTDAKEKSYTAYKLLVENQSLGVSKEVYRRYSEFDKLKKNIKKQFASEVFANLPRKHLVGNLNNDVIEARRIMLERYLQEIIMNPRVLISDLVTSFLSLDNAMLNTD